MKTYAYAFVIAILLFIPISFAFSVAVPQETIQLHTAATRQVTIGLKSAFEETIVVSLADAQPWMSLTESAIKVEPSRDGATTLIAAPPIGTATGIYRVRVIAESLFTQEKQQRDIFFSLSKGDVLDIEGVVVTGSLQPAGDVSISVSIDNSRPTTVQDAQLNIAVLSAKKEKVFEATQTLGRIDPKQKAVEEFSFALPPGAAAGEYRIMAKLEHGGDLRNVEQPFFVASKPVITVSEEKFPLLFGYGKTITARNNGNKIGDALVEEDLSGFESTFYAGPEPLSTSPHTWQLSDIQPLGAKSITYRVDFAPLFALIIAIIIVGWVVLFKMRTVRINKYIMEKKFLDEGEEFTVGIDIRNASGRKISELAVRDFVPTMFELRHSHGPKPIEKKVVGGRELIWKISDLYNREERVLTYKIIPIFGVSGSIRLPPSHVTYKWHGREMTHASFAPRLGVATPVEEKSLLPRRKKK